MDQRATREVAVCRRSESVKRFFRLAHLFRGVQRTATSRYVRAHDAPSRDQNIVNRRRASPLPAPGSRRHQKNIGGGSTDLTVSTDQ
jgi:hypothetical protein